MKSKNKKSGKLGRKIMAMMIGVNVILIASLFSFFVLRFQQTIQKDQDYLGESLASSLAMESELGLISNEATFLKELFKRILAKNMVVYLAVYSDEGKILLQSSKKNTNLSIPKGQFNYYLKNPLTKRELSTPHGKIGDYLTPVTIIEEDDLGNDLIKTIGLARVGLSTARSSSEIKDVFLFTGGVSIIALIAATLLTILITRRITTPLKKLEDGAKRISRGDLDFEISTTSDEEISRLANAFNLMSKTLKKTTVSRTFLDNILESMIDTMIVVDIDGKIKTVNNALLKLLSYSRDELIGTPFTNIIEDGDSNKELKKISASSEIGKEDIIQNSEIYYLTKDGKKIPMSISCSTISDDKNNITSFIYVAQNITRRKSAESDLMRRMREIEKFNKFMLNREKRILEVKREVNEALKASGQPPRYSC